MAQTVQLRLKQQINIKLEGECQELRQFFSDNSEKILFASYGFQVLGSMGSIRLTAQPLPNFFK